MGASKEFMIRPAVINDLSAIKDCLRELGYPQNNMDLLRHTFEEIQSNSTMGILVAEADDQIVGFLTYSHKPLLRLNARSLEIDELHILSKYRGKGIGRSLIEEVKIIARNNLAKRIILSTNRDRESYKRGFYTKIGFKEANSAWMRLDVTFIDQEGKSK